MERSGYRRYDYRLKNLGAASNDLKKFEAYGISIGTLREWKKKGVREFFTTPELDMSASDLISENLTLKAKLTQVTYIVPLPHIP